MKGTNMCHEVLLPQAGLPSCPDSPLAPSMGKREELELPGSSTSHPWPHEPQPQAAEEG